MIKQTNKQTNKKKERNYEIKNYEMIKQTNKHTYSKKIKKFYAKNLYDHNITEKIAEFPSYLDIKSMQDNQCL